MVKHTLKGMVYNGLTDLQQAILMLFVFILPSLIAWCALGMPTDRVAVGLLLANILSGILAFCKEMLGSKNGNGSN